MIRSKVMAGVYLFLVFLGGVAVGGFGYRLYTANPASASTNPNRPRNPEDYKRRYIEEMRTRLKLSEGQVGQLSAIMDVTRQKFDAFHQHTQPQLKQIDEQRKAIQSQYVDSVRAMLNDSQKVEYEKMRAEREARRQQRQKQQGGGH